MRSPLEDLKSRELLEINIWNMIKINITETQLLIITLIIIIKILKEIVLSKNVIRNSYIIWIIIYGIIKDNILNSLGLLRNKNSIIILSIMVYICLSNIIGLLPSTVVLTLDLLMNWLISLSVLLFITIISIRQNRENSIYLILIPNIPIFLIIMMGFIEIISYLSRCISLTIRLSANILGSLVMVKLISCMIWLFFINNLFILLIFIFFITFFVYILELFVCFIQSYIFSLLSSVYLLDSIFISL